MNPISIHAFFRSIKKHFIKNKPRLTRERYCQGFVQPAMYIKGNKTKSIFSFLFCLNEDSYFHSILHSRFQLDLLLRLQPHPGCNSVTFPAQRTRPSRPRCRDLIPECFCESLIPPSSILHPPS